MKTGTVAILMTTVAALLVAAAVANGMDVDTILLPSAGGEGLDVGQPGQAMAVGAPTRPWKCCDVSVCTKSDPPSCLCLDKVERCDVACARCVEASESDPSRRVCDDRYHGDPGPRCTANMDGGDDEEDSAAAADAAEKRRKEDEEDEAAAKDMGGDGDDEPKPRPWPCCNNTLCTKSFPPTCRCLDLVEVCAGTCQQCEPSAVYPFRYVCNDQYYGEPGPKCANDDDHHDDDVPSGASRSLAVAAPLLLAFVALPFIITR